MREVLAGAAGAEAIVFDLDGTLYAQRPVRRGMARRLVTAHVARPLVGVRTMRALAAYRRAQEAMRARGHHGDLARAQLAEAAAAAGVEPAGLADLVERWMESEPLDLVAAHARPGLVATLDELRARGVRLGVVSDYPAAAKLAAMGIDRHFDVVRCAQDADVGVFKPDPRGLLVTLSDLGVDPSRAVYVGDRAEVDGAAAAAAGVRFILLGAPVATVSAA